MEIKCDVLVVGAGPAGCSAAYYLKKLTDYDILLCDSKSGDGYNKYHHICGEVVNKKLFKETFPLKEDFIIEKIREVREFWPGDIVLKHSMEGFVIDRPRFLTSITEDFIRTGGEFINDNVIDVSQFSDKINVKTTSGKQIDCKYLVAADGANSIIREKLLPNEKVEKKVLLQYITDEKPERGVLSFYYDEIYEGDYMWVFPYSDKKKVGYPLLKSKEFKPDGKILEKHTRALAYGGLKKYTVGNVLFVGDAAAQTNALSKGGIRPAMVAGKMAAEAIANKNPSEYDKKWRESLFASTIVNEAFNRIKKMTNKELEEHIKPLSVKNRTHSYLKVMLFYRKYLRLYKAYEITNGVGW